MLRTLHAALALTVLAAAGASPGPGVIVAQQAAPPPTARPGVLGAGVTLLPNGWRIAPAGRHLQAGDFPLAMTATPDRRYLVVTNNGVSKPTLTVVDTERWTIKAKVPVEHAWLGLAWDAAGKRLYSAGAAENTVHVFDYAAGVFKQGKALVVAPPALRLPPGTTDMVGTGYVGRAISALDLASGAVRRTAALPAEPYTVLPASDGRRVYVSLWGGARVLALDAATLAVTGEVAVGDHPNAMVLSKDGQRLFVACANTNKVWVIDTATLAGSTVYGSAGSAAVLRTAPDGSSSALIARPKTCTAYSVLPSAAVAMPPT